ncbi:MAG: HAD family hydrolase [Negativicutes bacterium]
MKNYTNYLFDLDGTLCHTAPDIMKTFSAALAEHDLDIPLPDNYSFIGPPLGEIMRRFIPAKYDDKFVATVVLSFRRLYFASALEQSLPYDGVVDTLTKLKESGKRLFVVTNKAVEPARRLLKLRGLLDFFEDVYSPNVLPGKTMEKYESIAALIQNYSLNKPQTLYVGDTIGDIQAARKNAVAMVFAEYGYGKLTAAQVSLPKYRIKNFSKLTLI